MNLLIISSLPDYFCSNVCEIIDQLYDNRVLAQVIQQRPSLKDSPALTDAELRLAGELISCRAEDCQAEQQQTIRILKERLHNEEDLEETINAIKKLMDIFYELQAANRMDIRSCLADIESMTCKY